MKDASTNASASRWWPVSALLVLVALAWCAATGIWSPAGFGKPVAYLEDPSKSDIVAVYAWLKASSAGEAVPFAWKTVSRLNAPFTANWTDWPSLDELHGFALLILANLFGVFGGLNAALLLGHLLAAGAFYFVARVSGTSQLWSFVGGLAYGFGMAGIA